MGHGRLTHTCDSGWNHKGSTERTHPTYPKGPSPPSLFTGVLPESPRALSQHWRVEMLRSDRTARTAGLIHEKVFKVNFHQIHAHHIYIYISYINTVSHMVVAFQTLKPALRMASFIYPVIVAWSWGGGWIATVLDVGYMDFAGSGVVHLTGGVAGLAGTIVLGPRAGRFTNPDEFECHNLPLVVLGTFALWFGWYGFNPGSTLSMHDGATGAMAAQVPCKCLR